MENNFYVYVYLDNRFPEEWNYNEIVFEYRPFYVGKGRRYRINHHLQNKSLSPNTIKNNTIKSIIRETGELPLHYKIFENLSFDEANQIETNMIKYFGRINTKTGILSNMTDGGEGFKNMIITEESKRLMSKKAMGTKTYSNNGMSKIVEKYDLNNNLLEIYSSLREAAEKHKVDFKNISSCCRGVSKTAYGFKWKYAGKSYSPQIKSESLNRRKKVYQYDLDGVFINEFKSISDAEKATKIRHISCACLGKLNFAGGYQWRFEKENSLDPITYEKTYNIRRYRK